jgi:leucyl/phenylalanyl-tRNA--protein transferase
MNTDALSLEDILRAYANGLFPMADSADDPEIYWYDPPLRGQLSIASLHVPRRLRRTALGAPYEVRVDTAFATVIDCCAAATDARPKTWINPTIRDIFVDLHLAGFAHSVECWRGATLVGGVYGLALGGAFCGESMFSTATDASKIALLHLCARLWRGGFTVLDTQFTNPHLEQFGIVEIPRNEYRARLRAALPLPARFGGPVDEQAQLRGWLAHNKG